MSRYDRQNPVTWTLSGFGDEISPDPEVQIAVLQALGARHIEMRGAWGTNVVDLTDEQVESFGAALDRWGMGVSAVASPIGKVNIVGDPEDELRRLARAIAVAHRFGTRYIRMFSFYRPEGVSAREVRDPVLKQISALTRLAEREDVVLVHENEKDIYGDIPERVLDLIESVGSDALRMAWDSANFVQVGVAPFTDGYAMLRPHIEYLQVKDAIAATGEVVPAGEGDGQLLDTLTALRDDGYTGFASLEPHLALGHATGGFSGPELFGRAARALAGLLDTIGVETA
ncbi:sugar phosphate isomerase/epimerase family protein [Catenulispora rubra]|uniref:sugar phosphate isomerase/epimerase family protein n=1 Tax=Catenulispora rubra TaxID=280293 RepID=UPI001892002D|nr:sugar phosphate isomerase/epimerase family protein [Catenulispora rubra]